MHPQQLSIQRLHVDAVVGGLRLRSLRRLGQSGRGLGLCARHLRLGEPLRLLLPGTGHRRSGVHEPAGLGPGLAEDLFGPQLGQAHRHASFLCGELAGSAIALGLMERLQLPPPRSGGEELLAQTGEAAAGRERRVGRRIAPGRRQGEVEASPFSCAVCCRFVTGGGDLLPERRGQVVGARRQSGAGKGFLVLHGENRTD